MRDSKRDADVQNRLFDSVGEGEGGMTWKNGIETCIISYKKVERLIIRDKVLYGGGNDNPLQFSCLENPMDRGSWWVTVHWVAKSWTLLGD